MAEPNVELRGPVVPQDGVPGGGLPGEGRPREELPGTLGARTPPLLNVLLFILTIVSAFFMGSERLRDTALPSGWSLQRLTDGLAFAGALIAILLSHEMGHFLLARRHGVDASWPYFIPAPILSFVGTLGAVMRLRSLPKTRTALIDIAVAGPVAGFLVTLPVLALGIWLSPLVPSETAQHWSLARAVGSVLTGHGWISPKASAGFDLGRPLALRLMERLVCGELPVGQVLAYHPVAIAGWFGLFLTALNLLPAGQLDGGHLLYGASPRWHRALAPPISGALLGMGLFGFYGWLIWAVIIGFVFNFHPPLEEPEERLDPARRLWLLAAVALFALSFTPAPLLMIAER